MKLATEVATLTVLILTAAKLALEIRKEIRDQRQGDEDQAE